MYSVVFRLSMIFSRVDVELENQTSSYKALVVSCFSLCFLSSFHNFLSQIGTLIAELLPETICMGSVILWYAYKFVKELRRIILCKSFWKIAVSYLTW